MSGEPQGQRVLPRNTTICRGCGGLGFDRTMGTCRVCAGTGRVRGDATSCQHCGGRLFVDPDRLPDGSYEVSCVRCGARSYLDAQKRPIEPAAPPTSAVPEPMVTYRFDADTGRYTLDEETTALLGHAGGVGPDEGYRDDADDDDADDDADDEEESAEAETA